MTIKESGEVKINGRKPVVSGPLYSYLAKNVGLPVHVDDIVQDTKLTKNQVLSALSTLRKRKGLSIETVVHGQVYRMNHPGSAPKAEPSTGKQVFEEIGTTRTGVIILQSESGALYKAEEL